MCLISPNSGCLELVDEYNSTHGVFPPNVNGDRQRQPHMTVPSSSDALSRIEESCLWEPPTIAQNLTKLESLLDPERLAGELQLLETVGTHRPAQNSSTATDILSTWLEDNDRNNILSEYLLALPEHSRNTRGIHLHRAVCAVKTLPDAVANADKMPIAERLLFWSIARTLVSIYSWYTQSGPATIACLLEIHRKEGYTVLQVKSPGFADIVDHVVQYIHDVRRTAKDSDRPAKKRIASLSNHSGGFRSVFRVDDTDTTKFGQARTPLEEMPHTLYGLRPSKRNEKQIHLSKYVKQYLPGCKRGDDVYAISQEFLLHLLSFELIIPHLALPADEYFGSKQRSANSDLQTRNKAIARGAILHTLAEACGSDAIFASEAIIPLLTSPRYIFRDRICNDEGLVRALLNPERQILQPLSQWLAERLGTMQAKKTLDLAETLGEYLHTRAIELCLGCPYEPADDLEESNTLHLPATRIPRPPKHQKRQAHSSVVTVEGLLNQESSPNFASISLILREAINERRGLPFSINILYRILIGQHATRTDGALRNRDQTDPVRQYSRSVELLKDHLPGSRLTTPLGLSNLLSWMGTGQGNKTQAFLEEIKRRDGGFFSETAADLIKKFETIMDVNAITIAEAEAKSDFKRIPGYFCVADPEVWGQYCDQLSIAPKRGGKRLTLDEKFGPYFSPNVQSEWTPWLGSLLNQDPSSYHGDKKTWSDVMNLLKSLQIDGIQTGLTAIQLANNLVFSGLVTMPSPEIVAHWIFGNPGLGAYRGLEHLGFLLVDRPTVHSAFRCVYDHLDRYLSPADKVLLGFSPLFVEHVLCKVVRWEKRLQVEGGTSFKDLVGDRKNCASEWDGNARTGDASHFPIPFDALKSDVEKAVDYANKQMSGCQGKQSLHYTRGDAHLFCSNWRVTAPPIEISTAF